MRTRLFSILAGIILWSAALPAVAAVTSISTPTASYTSGTTLIPIVGADNVSAGATLSDGTMTLTFSTSLDRHTVPGGGWSTWGSPPDTETSTPRVLGTYAALTSETISLSIPAYTYGMEIEPDTFASFSISVDFMNGATTLGTVTRTVNGSAGARLFAAKSTTPITSVVITAPAGANGFAVANFRYSTTSPSPPVDTTVVPTLSEWGMIILSSLLGLGALFTLRRKHE